MGGSRGLGTAPEITQTPWEEQQGQLTQTQKFSCEQKHEMDTGATFK